MFNSGSEAMTGGCVSKTEPGEMEPQEYMLLRNRCAICHWPAGRPGRWMELHHIVGGRGRRNTERNYIACCCRCHHSIHNNVPQGSIPKGAVLAAKLEEDGEVDPEFLASLLRKKALSYEMEPIPEFYRLERGRNGGNPWF